MLRRKSEISPSRNPGSTGSILVEPQYKTRDSQTRLLVFSLQKRWKLVNEDNMSLLQD